MTRDLTAELAYLALRSSDDAMIHAATIDFLRQVELLGRPEWRAERIAEADLSHKLDEYAAAATELLHAYEPTPQTVTVAQGSCRLRACAHGGCEIAGDLDAMVREGDEWSCPAHATEPRRSRR